MLEVKTFNDLYQKYKTVKYKKNNEICLAEIIFEELIDKIENNETHEELLKKCKSYKELYEYKIKSNN